GGRPVSMALLEELGRHPPRLDIVLHPEIDAHKKTSHFSMSKKWEAVQDVSQGPLTCMGKTIILLRSSKIWSILNTSHNAALKMWLSH
ncbi:hypothetical protein, partial [Paratractidigestivibacter faecalis]|uniref:hypothetical protein n=1 Tax=Paratractidigestivibacter faecalis TaxID=2292441 RepID=UPI003A95C226